MKTHWQPHPIADLFPSMTPEEKAELKKDMIQRVENGLDPLEHAILLYEQMILDGRHRDEVWSKLAEENACDGFFNRNLPPSETFSPDKHGNLVAFLRAKSLNMVHRHIPADQKVAILLDAAEKYPEIKAALEAIKDENRKRQKEGKPLDAGDQRGNTAEQIGKLAGAGATTVKEVKRLKEKAPQEFKEVVLGKKTAKKALKEVAKKKKKAKASSKPKTSAQGGATFKTGEKFYRVYHNKVSFPPTVQLLGYKVEGERDETYLATNGESIPKSEALTLEAAKDQYVAAIKGILAELTESVTRMQARLNDFVVEPRY
jgi:hypothetical protein